VKITVKDFLIYDTKYYLIISRKISPALDKEILREYNSSPKFEVSDFKYISNTESCFYTNNRV